VQEVGFTWPSSVLADSIAKGLEGVVVVITVSLEANDTQQTDILTRVKEFGPAHKQLLATDDFVAIARAVIDGERRERNASCSLCDTDQ
jgi:hypothetical protein